MKRVALPLCGLALLATVARAEQPSDSTEKETVPSTMQGGGKRVKTGGLAIGEGFRGIGRGIVKTFTGKQSKEDYQEGGKELGTGFKDLGIGTAGVGRGVGNDVKDAVTGAKGDAPDRQSEK